MSKGSKIVPVRIESELLAQIQEAIDSRNRLTKEEPDSVSSWIKRCVREKLAHLDRSKKKKVKE